MSNPSSNVIWVDLKVEGKPLKMELDTGSAVSIIPHDLYMEKFNDKPLHKTELMLKTYSGENITPVGVLKANVEYKDQQPLLLDLYVVKSKDPVLMGRDWLYKIRLDWYAIKSLQVSQATPLAKERLQTMPDKYSDVFEDKLGTFTSAKAKLTLREDSQAHFCKARAVPYALRPKVEEELRRLQKEGILTKVEWSEWGTPIVPVSKKDGSVRICGDYKTTVNPELQAEQYPLPRIGDIFANLAGGQKFSKIDLRQAYHQLEMEEDSKKYLTINTHMGLFQYNRLVFGITSAPAIWQRTIDQVLEGTSSPFPRQGRSGGGIGLLYKESLRVTKVQNGAEESFEFCELLIQSSTSRKIRLVIVYRPHNSPNHQRVPISTFLREFSSYMEPIILTKEPLIIVGDFNIHVDIPTDTDAVKFLDLLDSLALFQHVTAPTHIHGHTLDLVLSRKMEDIIASPPSACHYISEHAAIRCHVAIGKSNYHVKKISFRKIKSIDIGNLTRHVGLTGLCERGKESPTNSLDLNAFVHDYNTTLSRVLDQHAPLKTKTVQSRPKVPWYSNEIAEAKRRRRKAEKRWKRTKLPADLNALKKHKNYVTYISTRAKRAFYTDFVSENSDDQGKLFRATRSLLIPNNDLYFPEYTNNTTLANDIGRYFDSKIRRIRGALDAAIATTNIETVTEDSVFKGDKELDHFESLTTEEVMKLVMKST